MCLITTNAFCLGVDTDSPKTLKSDKIYYNVKSEEIKASGNTELTNTAGQRVKLNELSLSKKQSDVAAKDIELWLGSHVYIKADSITHNSDETIAITAGNVQKVLDALKAPDASIESIKAAFRENGIWITDGLADALKGEGLENVSQAMYLLAEGVNNDTLAALDMANIDKNIDNFMQTTGKSLSDIAKMLMSDNKEELAEIARSLGIEVGEDLGNITPEALKKALIEGKKSVQEAADELASIADQTENKANMTQNVQENMEAVNDSAAEALKDDGDVVDAVDSTVNAITEKFETLPDAEKKQAEQMMNYIIEGIKDGNPLATAAIETAAKEIVKKAEEILSQKNAIEITRTFISGMKTAFDTDATVKGGSGAMNKFAKEVMQEFADELTNANGNKLGKEYINGIYKGLQDEFKSNLKPEARYVGKEVVSLIRESVNKGEGRELAYNLCQGLVDGLDG